MTSPTFRAPEPSSQPQAMPASAPTVTYPPKVQALIEEYTYLNEEEYRDLLADVVFAGDPDQLAALHSDDLAERTLFAAKHLVNQANNELNRRDRHIDPTKRANTTRFRDAMGLERTRAQGFVDNLRQRQGRVSNAPNASSRALRELAKNHPQEFVALKRKYKEQIAEERAAAKRERSNQRRARRPR